MKYSVFIGLAGLGVLLDKEGLTADEAREAFVAVMKEYPDHKWLQQYGQRVLENFGDKGVCHGDNDISIIKMT